jgi:hypothetical protein
MGRKRKIKGGAGEDNIAALSEKIVKQTQEIKSAEAKEKTAQVKENLVSSQIEKNAITSSLAGLQRFRLLFDTITKPFQKIGALFTRQFPISHYLALAVFIIFLIGGISFFAVRSKKGAPKKKKRSWIPAPIRRFFERLFPGYKMSLLVGQLSSDKPITEPRETLNGRCDNVIYKENILPGKKGGMCINTRMPEPITWVIDSEKIDELKDIPQSIKEKISNKGAKFIVKIPWKSNGLVYSPDCDNATFSDGTPAYLLIDNGLICNKVELEKIAYQPAYRMLDQHKDYKGLGVFE